MVGVEICKITGRNEQRARQQGAAVIVNNKISNHVRKGIQQSVLSLCTLLVSVGIFSGIVTAVKFILLLGTILPILF